MPETYISPYSKKPLTSIGLKTSIALETTAGTRPVTNYYKIYQVTALPDLDFENDTIDVTSFDDLVNHSYLPGLKDTGGLLSFEINYNDYDVTMWNDIAEKVAEATDGKKAWILIDIEGTSRKFFIPIIPVKAGMPGAEVNDKVTQNLNFTAFGDVVDQDITSTTTYYASGDYNIQ